jgi:hypothetical protein
MLACDLSQDHRARVARPCRWAARSLRPRRSLIASRRPGVAGQPIENLSPQWVRFGDARVIKILCTIVGHPKLRHQASGSSVSFARVRHNVVEADLLEAKLKRCSRRLHGEPLSPERPRQPPTDFDRRREAGRKAHVQKTDSPHEHAGCPRFQGPQAEAMSRLMADLKVDPGVARVSRCERAEIFHDVGIF